MILARFFGIFLLIIGLSTLNKKSFTSIIDGLMNNKVLFWLTGLLALTIGAAVLALYSGWSADWRVVITVIGWLALIKGSIIMLFPDALATFYKKLRISGIFYVTGTVAILIGAFLLYIGFIA